MSLATVLISTIIIFTINVVVVTINVNVPVVKKPKKPTNRIKRKIRTQTKQKIFYNLDDPHCQLAGICLNS